MAFGIDWARLAKTTDISVNTRTCGAGSPAELEFLNAGAPTETNTLVFISVFEMAEGMLSESRPIEVPFSVTLSDLGTTRPSWTLTKTLLWSYPLQVMRSPFPTLGRSWEVMVRLRDLMRSVRAKATVTSEDAPIALNAGANSHTDTLKSWDKGRLLRNIKQLRERGVSESENFVGPKFLALQRIFTKSQDAKLRAIVVMPVSPAYKSAFVDATMASTFASMLRIFESANPLVIIIRLDLAPELQSDKYFWDLVHLNFEGQQLATSTLLEELGSKSENQ